MGDCPCGHGLERWRARRAGCSATLELGASRRGYLRWPPARISGRWSSLLAPSRKQHSSAILYS